MRLAAKAKEAPYPAMLVSVVAVSEKERRLLFGGAEVESVFPAWRPLCPALKLHSTLKRSI